MPGGCREGVRVRRAGGQREPARLVRRPQSADRLSRVFEPGVRGWPEHACIGCSMVAYQVAHVAHLNARDTTLAFVSRAPRKDIERVKARMGWEMPWYTITDDFDTDFDVDEWHGTNAFILRRRPGVPHVLHHCPRRRGAGQHVELPRHDCARTPRGVGRHSPEGYPQTPPYGWWIRHSRATPDRFRSARPGRWPRRPVTAGRGAGRVVLGKPCGPRPGRWQRATPRSS